MNVDAILESLNAQGVDYILIGGMNFLLRHVPELTFDVDIWVKDTEQNLKLLNKALQNLGAEWARTEKEWRPVSRSEERRVGRARRCRGPRGAVDGQCAERAG